MFDSPWVPVFVAVIWLMHPWLGVLALVLRLLRAGYGLSSLRSSLRPQALGFRELGWALVALALFAVGYRLPL